MKKVYTKPTVSVVYFALSQNIARSCGYKDEDFTGHPTHADETSCGWDDGFGTVYWTAKPACGGEYGKDIVIGEVCYNNPNGAPAIFAS